MEEANILEPSPNNVAKRGGRTDDWTDMWMDGWTDRHVECFRHFHEVLLLYLKCREEVNTPDISLVVLQNVEEVNSEKYLPVFCESCLLVWFDQEMLELYNSLIRLRSLDCFGQIGLVGSVFQMHGKGSKNKFNIAKETKPSYRSRPLHIGSQQKLTGKKGIE